MSELATQNGEVLLCYHCGNRTFMHQVAEYTNEVVDYCDGFPCATFWTQWRLFLCPVCHEVSLRQFDWNTEEFNPYTMEREMQEKDLYPVSHNYVAEVPHGVRGALEAAIKVRHIDYAICVIALRRTLEKLCKDCGAVGSTLYDKLNDLAAKKVLPPILDEMASVLRVSGNDAAHADDVRFDKEMVSQLIDFTQTIIDYVYVLPQKLTRIQEKMNEKPFNSADESASRPNSEEEPGRAMPHDYSSEEEQGSL